MGRKKEELKEIAECGMRIAEWGKKIKKEESRADAAMVDVRGLMFDVDAEGRGGVIRRATGEVRFDE